MATQADIVVKKADGTTNVTFSAIVRSAGDKIAAVWQSLTSAAAVANRWTLKQVSSDNGPRTARKVTTLYRAPIVRSIGGVDTVVATVPMELSATIATTLTGAEIDEAVSQGLNLFASAQVKTGYVSGYAPN